jgi:hypothetical protein
MLTTKGGALQPASASRIRMCWSAAWLQATRLRALRTYWWWVPLLLLSMLVGSAVASHHKAKPQPKANPTLLVEKKGDSLVYLA